MDSRKPVKQQLRDILSAEKPERITQGLWHSLSKRLAPVSDSYLRELLDKAGLEIDQPYAGIRQHTFEDLESSLREMLEVYRAATASNNRDRARYCRRQVIGAKDRAKFLAHNPRTAAEKREEKREMAQWMLVWLENPEVFPAWVEARKSVRQIAQVPTLEDGLGSAGAGDAEHGSAELLGGRDIAGEQEPENGK